MNIPETVRIGSIDYKIELTKAPIVLDYKQCNGIIDYTQSKIILDSNTLEQQQLELTLLHEIVHGMLHDRGLEEQSNEPLVDAIAYALHQLIRDNSAIFETPMVKVAMDYHRNKEPLCYEDKIGDEINDY